MSTGTVECRDTRILRRVTLGGRSGVLILTALLMASVTARHSSGGSADPLSMSIVIEYYPAFDSDIAFAHSPHAAFVGGVVVEARGEGVLRFRDITDLSRMKERRLNSNELARLRDAVRVAVQSLRSEQQRPGIVIDFSRVHVGLSYGRDHVGLSFNMTIAHFLSATPLPSNDSLTKKGLVELEQLRREVRAVLPRDKKKGEVVPRQEQENKPVSVEAGTKPQADEEAGTTNRK